MGKPSGNQDHTLKKPAGAKRSEDLVPVHKKPAGAEPENEAHGEYCDVVVTEELEEQEDLFGQNEERVQEGKAEEEEGEEAEEEEAEATEEAEEEEAEEEAEEEEAEEAGEEPGKEEQWTNVPMDTVPMENVTIDLQAFEGCTFFTYKGLQRGTTIAFIKMIAPGHAKSKASTVLQVTDKSAGKDPMKMANEILKTAVANIVSCCCC